MRNGFPYASQGQVIGLFGGSFDPPHPGHVHVSREALKRFRLDQVWWLVSPGNPLKAHGPAPMGRRLEAARDLVQHPRIRVTDVARYPGVRFVWLMGADNLAQFHHWQRWRWIMAHVPVGVLARPGQRISARLGRAAKTYAAARLPAAAAGRLGRVETPAWCFLNLPMLDISSSEIRARGEW